jgi:filamin
LGREFSDDGEVMFEINPVKLGPAMRYVPKIVFAQEKSGDIPVRFLDEEGLLRVIFTPPRSGEYLTQVFIVDDETGVSVAVNDTPQSTNINIPPPPAPPEPEPEAKIVPLEELIQGFNAVGAEELPDGGFAFLIGYKERRLPDGYFVDVRINAAADGSDVEARVSDGGEGVTRVEFIPPAAGEYYVSAGLVDLQEGNGAEIVGSPFTVTIAKPTPEKEAKAFAADTFVDFTGFDRPRYDGTTSFLIGTRGKNVPPTRFHYEPKIICVSNGKAVIGAKAIDQKNGTFKVSFAPPLSGDYYIEVELVDKDDKRYTVKGSPFTVNVNLARSPAPSPLFFNPQQKGAIGANSRKFQPPSPSPKPGNPGFGTGKTWTRPATGGGVTSNVPKPVVPPWVQKTGRVWKAPASSPEPGHAPPVSTTPKYNYPAPVHKPAAVLAKTGGKKGLKGVVGVPASYPVSAHEIGLGEGESFDVSLEGPGGILPVDITYKGDAIFDVSYTPVDPGNHRIQFFRTGQLVLEDVIDVEEGADEAESIAVAFTFTIEARLRNGRPKTRGGDKFQVKINGPRGPVNTVQLADQNNGKYNVSYTLPGRGAYEINITLNGRHIAGSPWKQQI